MVSVDLLPLVARFLLTARHCLCLRVTKATVDDRSRHRDPTMIESRANADVNSASLST